MSENNKRCVYCGGEWREGHACDKLRIRQLEEAIIEIAECVMPLVGENSAINEIWIRLYEDEDEEDEE